MNTIEWDDFEKVELLVGTIVGVEEFPEARKPAYKLKIDLGPKLGIKNLVLRSLSYTLEKS